MLQLGHSKDAVSQEQPPAARPPNFLYLGTSKAGSTWIFRVLSEHPQVFLAPGKGTYYFDRHYENGWAWYLNQFRQAGQAKIVGDISHSYLFSRDAARRIAATLPDAKLMVCLREPVERSFSDYLDSLKNGRFSGDFQQALQSVPSLLERGMYATGLSAFLELFPRNQLHVAIFDDLRSDPQGFANQMFEFLKIEPIQLGNAVRQKMMPAARPRSRLIAQVAKRIARLTERAGWTSLRGRAKRSPWLRNLLYRPYRQEEIPTMDPETRQQLRAHFRDEIVRLDEMLGTTLCQRWSYC